MDLKKELAGLNKGHWPSYSRGLVRLGKKVAGSRTDLDQVLGAARIIGDPYYRATTLASLALEIKHNDRSDFENLFGRALDELEQVDPEWRRAEALEWVAGKMAKAGVKDFYRVVNIFFTVKDVERSRDVAKALIKNMGRTGSKDLYRMAELRLDDRDRLDLIRAVSNEVAKGEAKDLVRIDASVHEMKDAFYRGKAWAYLGLKTGPVDADVALAYFELALADAKVVNDDKNRLELLNYLCDNMASAGVNELERLLPARDSFQDAGFKARFLAHLAGKMNDSGADGAVEVFDDAVTTCSEINEPGDRARALFNVAKGLKKSGIDSYESTTQMALDCAEEVKGEAGENLLMKIRREIGEETGLAEAPEEPAGVEEGDLAHEDLELGRVLTLGLYNTYEKSKLSQAHVRAVARAAPLCWAYNLDLAVINFPFVSEEDVLERVKSDTQVGDGGRYLELLSKNGRIHVTDSPEELGVIVATTPNPDKDKGVADVDRLEGDLCFLLGVGKQGLPRSVMKHAAHHLEFTGRNVPLETCSAMGILSFILGGLRRT